MSEECMKIHEQIELIRNLKLTPDFIINIKVAHMSSIQSCALYQAAIDFFFLFKERFDDELNTLIFHQCADKDLVHRLSGLKQHPETGQLYNRDQWQREEVYYKKEKTDEEVEDEEEQVGLNGKHLVPLCLTSPVFGYTVIWF